MRRPRLHARTRWRVAVVLAACSVVSACTSDDAGSDAAQQAAADDVAGTDADADDAIEEVAEPDPGPAPAAVTAANDAGIAVRVDEATRDGEGLQLLLTLITRRELQLDDSSIRILTSGGIELPRAPEQQRTLPARSRASIEVHAEGLTDRLSTVTLDIAGVSLTIEVPEDGDTVQWAPAPERQVGLHDVVLRDNSPIAVVPYTFRTEGLVSELTFSAMTTNTSDPSLCGYRQHVCQLEDGAGNVYPMLRPSHEFGPRERVTGTLRFIGEIPRDQTRFRLRLAGSSGFLTTPDPEFSHEFTLPPAEEAPLRVTGGPRYPDPFDVGQTLSNDHGVEVRLGEMSFADDRIQLEVTYALEGDSSNWVRANYRGDSLLRDPSGYEHPLYGPSEDPQMRVEGGEELRTTLVFATPMAPGTTELRLLLATGDHPIETTIEIPAVPAEADDDHDGDDGDDDHDAEADQ